MMKRTICLIITFLIFTSITLTVNAQADQAITVKLDSKVIDFPDAKPYIDENNRTLVPVRFVSEALGAQVDWQAGTQLVTIQTGDTRIVLKVGESYAIVNNKSGDNKIALDTKTVLKGSRTFVPLRFVSEALLAKVDWDSTSRTVTISTSEGEQLPMDPNGGLTREQILKLKQYPDNVGLNSPNLDDYKTNEQYLKKHGLEEAKMAIAIAKGHMEAFNNVDYRVGLDEFKETEKKYINPQSYDNIIKKSIQQINDYKIVARGEFYTDPSLVYIDSTGTIRVRGTMKYIVYSCTDVEKIFGKGIELNQWIEEDVDIQLYTLTVGKWEYYYEKAFWLSPNPRYIN